MKIVKLNDEKMQVTGWAYVSTVDGKAIPDHSGDTIGINTLEKAAHDYILNSRTGKANHDGPQVAYIVNSFVFTKENQLDLGIDLGREGWLITMQITDMAVWDQVKKGEFKMFSVAGSGKYKKDK